jgi:hypothetical protein
VGLVGGMEDRWGSEDCYYQDENTISAARTTEDPEKNHREVNNLEENSKSRPENSSNGPETTQPGHHSEAQTSSTQPKTKFDTLCEKIHFLRRPHPNLLPMFVPFLHGERLVLQAFLFSAALLLLLWG